MLKMIITAITVASLCLLAILLNVMTPASAGPFGILTIFVLIYLSSLGLVTYSIYGASYIISHLSTVFITRRPIEVLTFKRTYYYSTIIAAVPVLLIGLQSVGAVGIYEFFLVVIFVIIGCLYISKKVQ